MTILRATMKVQCDTCKKIKMFVRQNPKKSDKIDDDDGWLFSEIQDLCPDCLKKKWG